MFTMWFIPNSCTVIYTSMLKEIIDYYNENETAVIIVGCLENI